MSGLGNQGQEHNVCGCMQEGISGAAPQGTL